MLLLSAAGLGAQEAEPDEASFKAGARVRAQVVVPRADSTEWFIGKVGADFSGCGLLVLDDLPTANPGPDGSGIVAFQDVRRLELSSLYDGRIDPETMQQRTYTPGKSLEGETWIDISVDSLVGAQPEECVQSR